jgi:pyruvate/2-oxoglutarate dehydrogenase complex dihydrolipoamide dehydrogenase (E3) component
MTGASDLALSKAGVMHDKDDGIFVDKCQRTSTYHIMAAGVCVCVCVCIVRACVRAC